MAGSFLNAKTLPRKAAIVAFATGTVLVVHLQAPKPGFILAEILKYKCRYQSNVLIFDKASFSIYLEEIRSSPQFSESGIIVTGMTSFKYTYEGSPLREFSDGRIHRIESMLYREKNYKKVAEFTNFAFNRYSLDARFFETCMNRHGRDLVEQWQAALTNSRKLEGTEI